MPRSCPPWPPRMPTHPRGHLLVHPYGGINQQLSQVSDALVLGHALGANVIVPELLVHHWWNDSYRLDELIDVPHWMASAAKIGVRAVHPPADNESTPLALWYRKCGHKGSLPDAGLTPAECKPYHVALGKDGTIAEARTRVGAVLDRHGYASVITLKRMHEPCTACPAAARMATRLVMAHAHYLALREPPSLRALIAHVLRTRLTGRFIVVHLRQELDILVTLPSPLHGPISSPLHGPISSPLSARSCSCVCVRGCVRACVRVAAQAISGCIGIDDPRHAAAERVLAGWGGWASRPLAGARKNLARFNGSTSAMRAHGKCGVGVAAVLELLRALRVPRTSAVYVAGASDGLEPLQGAYRVLTQRQVLPPEASAALARHASYRALFDAALGVRAHLFVAARGNFDRAVVSRRALRMRPSLDSMDVYYGAKRAQRAGKSTFESYVRGAAQRAQRPSALALGGKQPAYRVYENPMPTVRACGALLELAGSLDGGQVARALGGGARVTVEEAAIDVVVEEAPLDRMVEDAPRPRPP